MSKLDNYVILILLLRNTVGVVCPRFCKMCFDGGWG